MASPPTAPQSARFIGANRAALVIVGVLSLLGLAYAILRVDILRARIVVLRTELTATEQQQSQLQARFDALAEQQREQAMHWQAAESTLNQLSSGLTAQISRATDQWTRAEILYLTRLTQDQLNYGRDIASARSTLTAAIGRATAQPGAISDALQAQLQQALATLNGLPSLQLELVQQHLQSLVQQAAELPLASQATAPTQHNNGFWATLKQAASRLVLIRRSGEQVAQLISQQDAQVQRDYLVSQLLAARTAATRGDTLTYQQALRAADTWLAQAFDQGDPRIQTAHQMLTQLKSLAVSQSVPDLGAAIAALQATLTKGSAS